MEIVHYLEPLKKKWIACPGISTEASLGGQTIFFDGESAWFENNEFDVAIIGIPEVRNSTRSLIPEVPAYVRSWLYGMRRVSSGLRIADLGDIKGNGLKDRYYALSEVINYLFLKNVPVLLIGGSQDLTLPASRFLDKQEEDGNIVIVDAFLDVDPHGLDFSSSAYIHKLTEETGNKIGDLSVLGTQLYYCSKEQEDFMDKFHFQVVRLKDLRAERIDYFEVFIRNASLLSFDFGALRGQPSLPCGGKMPNGFSEAEACRIFWYAGASDVLKVAGLFDISLDKEDKMSQVTAAQMVWHFLEGCGAKEGDYPLKPIEEYELKAVYLEEYDETLKFYHNPANDRWWINVPDKKGGKIVPCHADDYKLALNKELPQIWWRHFIRIAGNPEITKR
ncbi:arginase family protein [Anaerophaga thermohalophila]|uniref:arginase family protein n=1 Tax=Anaerophaga thermohalophila TaxID=177400 RepID=UPI000237CC3D|nr:arginase [Anaerophaga thermohalophila]